MLSTASRWCTLLVLETNLMALPSNMAIIFAFRFFSAIGTKSKTSWRIGCTCCSLGATSTMLPRASHRGNSLCWVAQQMHVVQEGTQLFAGQQRRSHIFQRTLDTNGKRGAIALLSAFGLDHMCSSLIIERLVTRKLRVRHANEWKQRPCTRH